MKFVEGGYVVGSEQCASLDRLHGSDCIYACMTKEQAKILGFKIGDGMSEINARRLVVKRHPRVKAYLVLCDEETGQPLSGQTDLKVESSSDNPTKVTVTFEAWGAHGVRFEDEPRSE